MSHRDRFLPSFWIHPKGSVFIPSAYINLDDSHSGFEDEAFAGWTKNESQAGLISLSSTTYKHGRRSCRINCPLLTQAAYLSKNLSLAAEGTIAFLTYVYITTYYGNTWDDRQFIGAYCAPKSKYVLGWVLSAVDVEGWSNDSSHTFQAAGLEKGKWHKLYQEFEVATKRSRAWLNDALVLDRTCTTADMPTVLYMGDGSYSTMRGDFYWDSVILGRTA